MTPQISIITPWLDRPEFIDDYERATRGDGVEVIIIDNASTAANAHALREMVGRLNGKYIRNEENRWFSAANNQGMSAASGNIVLFLNNDIAATGGWLDRVRTDVQDRALFGPTLRATQVEQTSLPYLEGWCIAATRETWNALGGWNEQAFQMPYGEDVELCLRAKRLGFELKQVNWQITHKVNGTSYEMMAIGEGIKKNMNTLAAMLKGNAAAPVIQATAAPLLPPIYRSQGRLMDAQRDYREALALQPQRADWWLNYGIVLRDCGRYEASVEALRRAGELAPALAATVYAEIGVTFDTAARFPEAIEAMEQVVRLRPDNPAAHSNLAVVLNRAGRYAESAQAARTAIHLDPNFAPARAQLAQVLFEQDHPQAALDEAEIAVRLDPHNALGNFILGCAHKKLGNRAAALKALERAHELNPLSHAAVHEIRDLLSRAP